MMEEHIHSFDICVVCALYEEASAVISEFSLQCGITFATAFRGHNRLEYRHTTIENRRGESLTILVTWLSRMGPIRTVLDLIPLLQEVRPRFVAMTGICAGDRNKVKLGDVIIATGAYHLEEGKKEIGPDGQSIHLPEAGMAGATTQILQYAQSFDRWREPVQGLQRRLLGAQEHALSEPERHIGVIASSMAVRADYPFTTWTRQYHRKTIGVDMEAAAFYLVLRDFPSLHGLVVKGVSDYGDSSKNDVYHDYAARASALYMLHFIQEYVTEETMSRRDAPLSLAREGRFQTSAIPSRLRPEARVTGCEPLLSPFVFLCYAHADSESAIRLKAYLLSQGIQVWVDQEGLQPGTLDWEESVRMAIRSAQAVLLIVSPDARTSRYVRDELRIAEMYQHPVYPFWVAGTHWIDAVPLGWGGMQYIDARESRYEQALAELVALLHNTPAPLPKAKPLAFEPRNPYKGLRAFTSNDTRDFFGRDALIHTLITTLEKVLAASEEKSQHFARLLVVVGPSGSGKSSVVRAGLLPRLQQGAVPGSEQWLYLDPIMPGNDPFESLAVVLAPHLPDRSLKTIHEDLEEDSTRGLHRLALVLTKSVHKHVVLVVDQFEELFTQTTDEKKREQTLDLLATSVTEPGGPLVVILTLRADFSDRPMHYPDFYRLIEAHKQTVLPMQLPELRAAIEKPAALPDVQLTFEGDLVGDLLFEMQGQTGALPLMQFTLDQLFQQRSGHHLMLSAYHKIGGVKGALARHAEATYLSLSSEEHRHLARSLFLRLIDPGIGEQDTTRRRAALTELQVLDAGQTTRLNEVAHTFIAARLLTTMAPAGIPMVEISHEAVIRAWFRLSEWLHEAHEDIRLQKAISEDAAEWRRYQQTVDRLYRGSQLDEALAWAERNLPSLDEMNFFRASVTERERVATAERKRQEQAEQAWKRLTRRLVVGGIVAGLGIVATTLIAANALQSKQPGGPTPATPPATSTSPKGFLYSYSGHRDAVTCVAWSPDDTRLASASYDTTAQVWDASNGSRILTYSEHLNPVTCVAWSPDGTRLASGGFDDTVQVWDASTKFRLLTYTGHINQVWGIAWSPDGTRLASASEDQKVQVWDARTGRHLLTYTGHVGGVWAVTWSPDSTQIASAGADKTVQVWDARTGRHLLTYDKHTDQVWGVAWSPDGNQLASSGYDKTVQVWNARTGRHLFTYDGHASVVYSVAWSHNSTRLASASADTSVQVWDTSTGGQLFTYTRHTGIVYSVAWSHNSTRLASASADTSVQVWLDLPGQTLSSSESGKQLFTNTVPPQES